MPPDHLAVYLGNSCNLACSYCYVAVNQGPPARLSFEDVKAAVDHFVSEIRHPRKKITFLGGEPLLNWPLFQKVARYARQAGGRDIVLQTFTNGTLLSPERLAFLDEQDVHCTVSLDGRKGVNDKHRVYFKSRDRSVFDDVLARLKDLPKERLGVSLVFTSETVSELLANVDYFYQMGFSRITFNPELYEFWPAERLEVMRRQLAGLKRYYRLILERGLRPFQIQILYAVLEAAESNRAGVKWWHDCHNVVLGPDAHYYACDKALSLPVGKAADQRVGRAGGDLDWDARRAHFDRAVEDIEARGHGKDESFCPMGVYFYCEETGQDPSAMLANFHRVAQVFADGLLELVSELRPHPAFQELYVDARLV